MAFPTTNSVLAAAAGWLGDIPQDVYTNAVLHSPFFETAWGEVWNLMLGWGLQTVQREVTYTLPANTTSLLPASASISDMGEPSKVWERGSASEDWVPMEPVDELPQADPSGRLIWWKWENNTFYFIGCPQAKLLKFEYSASAVAPAIGATISLDGSKEFLAVRTAALIAPTRGMPDLAGALNLMALGPSLQPDGTGGLLRQLVYPMLKEKQKRPARPQAYRVRSIRL